MMLSVIGGPPAREYFNDVWRSRDGRSWERVKKNQEILPGDETHWAQRAGGIAVVKGGYMYMVGGEEGFTCTPEIPFNFPRAKFLLHVHPILMMFGAQKMVLTGNG